MPISDLPREAQQIAANLRRTESEQAALEDAYKKTYPSISSEPATTSEEPLDPEMQALKEKYELRVDGDDDQPLDAAAENYRVEQELRQRWGEDYEMNVNVSMNVAKELFGDDTDLLMRIGSAIGDDVKAMEMLLKLARGRQ